MTVNSRCGWGKWAEVSSEAGCVRKRKETMTKKQWVRKRKHGNSISIRTEGVKNGNSTKPALEKKYFTQETIILRCDYVVYSLTMRFSNWCQRSQSTQSRGRKKVAVASLDLENWEKKKLADGERISMTFFFPSRFQRFALHRVELYSKHVNSYKINLFTSGEKMSAPTSSRNRPRSDYSSWKSDETREREIKIPSALVEVRRFFLIKTLIACWSCSRVMSPAELCSVPLSDTCDSLRSQTELDRKRKKRLRFEKTTDWCKILRNLISTIYSHLRDLQISVKLHPILKQLSNRK